MTAFLKRYSCPLISFRSSGIEVKPRRANNMTPIGRVKFCVSNAVRWPAWIKGTNFMKMPKMIMTTAMTPHVSTRFKPLSPRLKRSVMMIQKNTAKKIGDVLPGISFDRD